MTSGFHEFDGDNFTPIDVHTPIPNRRATDTNLEIIAHKLSRIANELTQVKEENSEAIKRLEQSMRYTHATLTEATTRAAEAAEAAKESVKATIEEAMSKAYPDGDPDGHRIAHEAWIKKVEESAAFWKKMREKLAEHGLIVFLGFAILALWQAFLRGPMK